MAFEQTDAVVKGAFGAKNRARLIEAYFNSRAGAELAGAWEHIYRLLLWVDQTTGLAHCYESDKTQPGKNWYGRSLSFHDWVSRMLRVPPAELATEIDWLFRRATADLAAEVLRTAQARLAAAQRQRKPYEGRGMPTPGEDPELIDIIKEVLGDYLAVDVPPEKWQVLVQRVRQYLALENKRKNLVGEGFEDVIAEVVRRAPQSNGVEVRARPLLHDLPGFNRAREGDKPNKVDVAILRPQGGMRTLVTAKWSVRADREKQFAADYSDYITAESDRQPFEYVFVTNEFDPARLMRACEQLAGNHHMFTHVVHINTEALQAAYGPSVEEESMKRVLNHVATGRLLSFDRWLKLLAEAH